MYGGEGKVKVKKKGKVKKPNSFFSIIFLITDFKCIILHER